MAEHEKRLGASEGSGEPCDELEPAVSHWLEGLRDGESLAAQQLWNLYFARLIPIAQAKLAGLSRDRSAEDVALSAMKSMMIGIQANRFPKLSDRDELWPLLVTITARKAISEQRRQLADRRSRNRECSFEIVQEYLGSQPSAEFAVEVADEMEHLTDSLEDTDLKRIVELKLGGWTNDEIASELGCTSRTITRKLTRIRQEWSVMTGLPFESIDGQV